MKVQAALIGLLAMAGMAQASLLYPQAATDTVLNSTGSVDDTSYTVAFPLTGFATFGAGFSGTSVTVNNNGWIGLAPGAYNGTTYGNVAMPFTSTTSGTTMIAPMWDDLYMTSPGTGVTSQSVRVANPSAGTFVVTWAHEEYFLDTSPDLTFQAILYGNGNSANLPAGTIIFCYDVMNVASTDTNASFTLGLNKGTGTGSAGVAAYPGAANNATQVLSLAGQGYSFTPDGAGGYIVTPGKIPAPSALALLGLGGVIAGRRKR